MDLPDFVIASMSEENAESIALWWGGLSEASQQDFLLLWDARADDCAYVGFIEDERLKWETLPLVVVGEFVEPDSASLDHDEMKLQLLEFINGHEDIEFFLTTRQFHICRAHKHARDVVARGVIPADFVCPLKNNTCPMLHILGQSPGQSVCLRVKARHPTVGVG